jgi:hypothetical protein
MDKLGFLLYCNYQLAMNNEVLEFNNLSESEKNAWTTVATFAQQYLKQDFILTFAIENLLNKANEHNEKFKK